MLKLKVTLTALFVMSLATLSFASSLVPAPVAPPAHPWIVTFE